MPRTTDKADKILEFVNDFIQENGYAPSVREIGQAVGLRSTASVSYHLNNMKESGKLRATGTKGAKRATVTAARPGQIPILGPCGRVFRIWPLRTRRAAFPGTAPPAALHCVWWETA